MDPGDRRVLEHDDSTDSEGSDEIYAASNGSSNGEMDVDEDNANNNREDAGNYDNSSDEVMSASESDESDEQYVGGLSSSDDEPAADNSESSDNDELDENGEVENVGQEGDPFYIDAEANGMNLRLGNRTQLEVFLTGLARNLACRETYTSLFMAFQDIKDMHPQCQLPTNDQSFWKILNRQPLLSTKIYRCAMCWVDLGSSKKRLRHCRCGRCGPGMKNAMLSCMMYPNIESQIKILFRKQGMAEALNYPQTRIKRLGQDSIEDVYDGTEYRRHSREGGFLHHTNNNYSFVIWTDGIEAADSSRATVWPVFMQILELSPRARQRYIILGGVYVGPQKPHMATFLQPLCRQLRQLHDIGIVWHRDPAANPVQSRFITLMILADSEARYSILGMMRHNSEYGCTMCYARGENVAAEGGERRTHHIYRWQPEVQDRTDAEIRAAAARAEETDEPQQGVKNRSAMAVVPGVDLRSSQRFDAMHCFWEGIFKKMYDIWSKGVGRMYYFGPGSQEVFNTRFDNVKRTTKLSRHPRSLINFAKYKATEYRNMAWFYWLPCAHDFMPEDKLLHYVKFANATYILCKNTLLPAEIEEADQLLREFCREFAPPPEERHVPDEDYPESACTFNLHLLVHAARCATEWGPLDLVSAFDMESWNRRFHNFITGPNDRCSQIVDRFLLSQMIDNCLDREMTPGVKETIWKRMGGERWMQPPVGNTGRIFKSVASQDHVAMSDLEQNALYQAGVHDANAFLTRHSKVSINGVVYEPRVEIRDATRQFDDSNIYVRDFQDPNDDGHLLEIASIITWINANDEIANGVVGRIFDVVGPAFGSVYMKVVEATNNHMYVDIDQVVGPAVKVETETGIYMSPLPTYWSND